MEMNEQTDSLWVIVKYPNHPHSCKSNTDWVKSVHAGMSPYTTLSGVLTRKKVRFVESQCDLGKGELYPTVSYLKKMEKAGSYGRSIFCSEQNRYNVGQI